MNSTQQNKKYSGLTCPNYCGITCVNGHCPNIPDEFSEYEFCVPFPITCEDCFYNRGCEDCCFYGTEYCDKSKAGD